MIDFIYVFDQSGCKLFVQKIWVTLHFFFTNLEPEVQAPLISFIQFNTSYLHNM